MADSAATSDCAFARLADVELVALAVADDPVVAELLLELLLELQPASTAALASTASDASPLFDLCIIAMTSIYDDHDKA